MKKRNSFIERSIMAVLSFLKDALFADEYAAKKGLLQLLDTRMKALVILFLLLAVLFSKSIYFLAGMYVLCLFLAAASSIPLGFFLKRTWFFIPLFSLFIAGPALFNVFTPGEQLLSFKFFGIDAKITQQGLFSAAIFFLRVLTSISLSVLLVLTCRHSCLLKVLRIFKIPQVFVMTLGMCYRYIYLFIEIIEHTYLGIKSRAGFVSSVRKGQGIVAWNIASLWQRSYALHHDVYQAMLSRGYSGEAKAMDEFHAACKDWLCLGIAVFIFILSLWQNLYLG